MDIYAILSSKPHDLYFLNHYCRFIEKCRQVNSSKTKDELGYTENHHICPKAKDLFPEYKSLKDFPWNKAVLTARQHFIAHKLLWKSYGRSQSSAFFLFMRDGIDANSYEIIRKEHIQNVSTMMKGKCRYIDENGEKFWLNIDDPIIKEKNLQNVLKGKISTAMKGKSKYRTPEGMLVGCFPDDPRVLSGEFVHFAKGRQSSDYQKQRARETCTGRKLSQYAKDKVSLTQRDNNIYTFQNKDSLETFTGIRLEFKKKFGFNVDKLFGKCKKKFIKGWYILKNHSLEPKSMDDVSIMREPGDDL